MDKKHLDLASEFIKVIEKTQKANPELGVGDAIISLCTALGYMVHYRKDDSTIEEVIGHISELVRMHAERADVVLSKPRDGERKH